MDVVVGTPGRVIDLVDRGVMRLTEVETRRLNALFVSATLNS